LITIRGSMIPDLEDEGEGEGEGEGESSQSGICRRLSALL
jgi:hypothetical protein